MDYVDIPPMKDFLLGPIMQYTQANGPDKDVYFTHSNHLGSANWITESSGIPVQYIHYAPYGELIADQQVVGYDERYKFTGKERDRETGYDMFGARYLWSDAGIWTSVDPLAGDYPQITPYAYGLNNPLKYKDPNGKWVETAWDIANLAMDAVSLESNIKDGNFGAAMIDGVGLVLDLGAAILPVVPGGAGTAIKAYKIFQ